MQLGPLHKVLGELLKQGIPAKTELVSTNHYSIYLEGFDPTIKTETTVEGTLYVVIDHGDGRCEGQEALAVYDPTQKKYTSDQSKF